MKAILCALMLAGCAQQPPVTAEPGVRSKTTAHEPTKAVPYKWTEDRIIRMDWHDTLYDGDKVIPGIPDDVDLGPVVVLNGTAMK